MNTTYPIKTNPVFRVLTTDPDWDATRLFAPSDEANYSVILGNIEYAVCAKSGWVHHTTEHIEPKNKVRVPRVKPAISYFASEHNHAPIIVTYLPTDDLAEAENMIPDYVLGSV